jgi:hypothetical protein
MISSEGRGMQADSIAIRMAIPEYPVAETTVLMKTKIAAKSFSVMGTRDRVTGPRLPTRHHQATQL